MFLTICLFFISCADLERDNSLDPKNSNSYVDRKVLVELFVNDASGYDYCYQALKTIEQISERDDFNNKLLILEYHVKIEGYNDPNSLLACYEKYKEYVPTQSERGIPDAFFNGKIVRVQGATIPDVVEARYLSVLEGLTGEKGYYRMEANKSIVGNFIDLDIRLAKLGSQSKKNISINAVLYEDLGVQNHRFVVRHIFQQKLINFINSGEIKAFNFSAQLSNVQNMNSIYTLVFVQNQNANTKEVYQVEKF